MIYHFKQKIKNDIVLHFKLELHSYTCLLNCLVNGLIFEKLLHNSKFSMFLQHLYP